MIERRAGQYPPYTVRHIAGDIGLRGFQTTRALSQQTRERLQQRADFEVTMWLYRDPVEAEVPRCQTRQKNGEQCASAGVSRHGVSWTATFDIDGLAVCARHR